ncbi:class I adenylate-forming enzyme family protein [Phenylobacterium conjunctum]|uniref:Class I adenylate-forming enzyme family protein n=1 Tax=Phenylobacterium conjunctum TaxID=1298959 RepID=A0ABW3T237_9CAUL
MDVTSSGLLIKSIRGHGSRRAVLADGRAYSYADLDAASDGLAGHLRALGLGRGARVALHLRNGVEYPIAELAILKLAAVRVPLNELMGREELAYCLRHAAADVLISHADLPTPQAEPGEVLARHRISVPAAGTVRPGETPWDAAVSAKPLDGIVVAAADDTAVIQYTGGTTGHPKGAHHTYGRIGVCLLAHVVCGDIRSDEVMLLTTPLPHSAGFHMAACFLQGGYVVLEERFDAARFAEICEQHSVTWTFAVPTMLYRLLDQLEEGGGRRLSLRTVVYGAAPMSRPRLEEALAKLGPVFVQIYGQTECPNFITTLTKHDHLDPALLTSCGRPVPFVDLRVRRDDEGPVGEVEVRSPYLLTEYYGNAEATAAALSDGWLKTGDLGYLRDGYLFLVDRAKDMIITGGMNVYSSEVESALRQHEAVREVAVIGMPDADWGEAVTAVIVPAADTSPASLRAFAKTRLSAYKVPKTVVLVEELPLTTYGKIDKKRLRQALADAATAS